VCVTIRRFVVVAVGMLMLAVGCTSSGDDSVTYRVRYFASVGGDGSDSIEVTYFHDSTQNTVTPPGPAWDETFEVENPSLPHVEIDVSASRDRRPQPPDLPRGGFVPVPRVPPPPRVSCGIEVDGVERARHAGDRSVRCSVDLRDLGHAGAPGDSAAGKSGSSGVVLVLLGFVLVLVGGVVVGFLTSRRNARPEMGSPGPLPLPVPSSDRLGVAGLVSVSADAIRTDSDTPKQHPTYGIPGYEREPHVRFMWLCGIVAVVAITVGVLATLNTSVPIPPVPGLPGLPGEPGSPAPPSGPVSVPGLPTGFPQPPIGGAFTERTR
jgi:hypothetical protein